MTEERAKRKLSAILSADVKGYSRLMGQDEADTVFRIKGYRALITDFIQCYRGRVIDSSGDNILAEFASVVDATECSVKIQEDLKNRNAELPESHKMEFRIGINLGDVIEDGESIYGDGVNIAARIESLAEAGGICISGTSYDQVKNKFNLKYKNLGEHSVKNITEPVRVYRVMTESEAANKVIGEKRKSRKWMALAAAMVLIVTVGGIAGLSFYSRHSTKIDPNAVAKMAYPLPDKPSIAVLPFVNMSGDPEQEYFSDGLSEDLITDLSKFRDLFVISRNSVFTYKGQTVKPKQVRKELGVRYMLEGSVRKAGNRVRITAQLTDTKSSGHQWAERYDRDLKDIFTLQDEITQQIVSALGVKFLKIEQERAFRKDTANLNAFDYNLRGWWHYRRFTKEDNEQARRMFEKAIEIEPKFADAYSGLGFTYYEQWARQWSPDARSLERAFELAKRAISLYDSLSQAYVLLSRVYLWRKQHTQAIAEQERAIALNPNNANNYADLAEILVWTGRPKEALGLVEKAMRLNPHYPATYLFTLGFAYSNMGRYEEAIVALKRALSLSPDHYGIHIVLAEIYSQEGLEEEARAHVAEALSINPQLSIEILEQIIPIKDRTIFERAVDNLRRAGLN